jgi:hypothetical protein
MDPHALIELFAQNGLIDGEEVADLAEIADAESTDIFTVLEAAGCGGRDEVLKSIAHFKGLDFLDLQSAVIPPQLLKELHPDLMRIYRCFPAFVSVDLCKVCMVDPLDDVARSELSRLLGKSVEVVVADPELVEAMVQSALEGRGEDSPLVDASRTALVTASLGSARSETLSFDAPTAEGRDFRLVWSLSLLAVAAVALTALYLGQKRSLTLADDLRAELEEVNRNIEFSDIAAQKELREISGQVEKLRQLLEQNEVDAITLQQLEVGVQRMEGQIAGIEKLKAPKESDDQAMRDPNASGR